MTKQFLVSCSILFGVYAANANEDTLRLQSKMKEANLISITKTKSALKVSFSLKEVGIDLAKSCKIKMLEGSKWTFATDQEKKIFTDCILPAIGNDSGLLNSVNEYIEGHQKDSLILVQVMPEGRSTSGAAIRDSTKNTSSGSGGGKIPPNDNMDLIVGILSGIVFGATGYFFWLRWKQKSSNLPPPEYRIPEELTSYFNIDKKEIYPDKIIPLIKEKYEAAEEAIDTEKKIAGKAIAQKDKSIADLNDEAKKQKDIIAERDKSIENAKNSIQSLNDELKQARELLASHKEISFLILEKFYTPLIQSLDNNTQQDTADVKQVVLSNIIATAFHSVSYFRILNNLHMNSDNLNLQKLKGEPVVAKANATFQSRFTDVEPLVFYVMELMKNEGMKSLDTVFIHGYKIGD